MTPYYERDGITIYHGDCRDFESIPCDLLLTDPPYLIPVGSASIRGNTVTDMSDGYNHGDIEGWERCVGSPMWAAVFRAMKLPGPELDGMSLFHRYYLVKSNPPATPRPVFVSAVEECDILKRQGAKWYGTGYEPNRWIGPGSSGKGHPAEKPLGAIKQLVSCLSAKGKAVLDPFMGSGTTLVAAKSLHRQAIGIEIEERYCEIAAKRLEQGVLPLSGTG